MNKTPLEEWISRKIDVTPENFTPGELIEYQFAKIRSTLSLVKQRSRFYREKMKDVEIDEINSYHDLQRLPFTTADDIKNDPMKFLCVSQNDIERIVTLQSSGTSGRPKRIFFTRDDQELTTDFFDHGMRNLVDPGDRVMILLPGELPGKCRGFAADRT